MNAGYRELVGLQVAFSEIAPTYSIQHFYQWKENGALSPILTMRTYDLQMAVPRQDIITGLQVAWAAAILSIWKQTKPGSTSEYMQFHLGATPDKVGLGPDWTIWAEW